MTSTSKQRLRISVRLLGKTDDAVTFLEPMSGVTLSLRKDQEYLGDWVTANIGSDVDVSIDSFYAEAFGLGTTMAGRPRSPGGGFITG